MSYTRIFIFLPLYHGREENQRFFCLWSFMWSKPLLCRFRQPGKVPKTQALQGFEAFRLTLSRIQPRHSQTRRDTNFAIPGYSVSSIIPRRRKKQRLFCPCPFLWSKPFLLRSRQPVEIPQTQSPQGLPAFRLTLFRIPPWRSQAQRSLNRSAPDSKNTPPASGRRIYYISFSDVLQ